MKKYMPFIIVALLAGGGGFWGGTASQGANQPSPGARGADRDATFRSGGPGGAGGAGGTGFRNGGRNGGFLGGEVLSKDEKSLTIKLPDGGSKIVLFSDVSTKVFRSAEIKAGDVAVGDQVMVNGTPNDDGSVTASMIQIRPPMPAERPAAVIDEAGAREVRVEAKNFAFDPAEVRVKQGEKIKLTLVNGDGTHGIGIPAFNVSIRPTAGGSGSAVFVADQKGSFPFFCNVFCGEGHRAMRGTLIVE